MKLFHQLAFAAIYLSILTLLSCNDDSIGYTSPVNPVTKDIASWPFDECIDSTVLPGNDFYGYISVGYTKRYGQSVRSEQESLGGTSFVKQETANPQSPVIRKLMSWSTLDTTAIHAREKADIIAYNAVVDTMGVNTLIKELIHNGICERRSIVSVNLLANARKVTFDIGISQTYMVAEFYYDIFASLTDTTSTYITDLVEKAKPVTNIICDYLEKTTPEGEHTKGFQLLLDALGLKPAESELLSGKTALVSEFIEELTDSQDQVQMKEALVSFLKLSRLFASVEIDCDGYGKMRKIDQSNFAQAKFFSLLLADSYCRQKITKENVEDCQQLAEQFRSTLRLRFDSLDWMSPTTKVYAKQKLDNMYLWYGMPESDIDAFDVEVLDTDFDKGPSLCYMNLCNRFYEKVILPTVRKGYSDDALYLLNSTTRDRAPYVDNLYYDIYNNTILCIASNLLPPVTRNDVSLAYNYAVIGAAHIGHEICHAFDSEGSKYDEVGNERNWWTVSDALKYKEKQNQLISIYGQHWFSDSSSGKQTQVDGSKTLTENMADFGGITIGLDALCRLRQSQGYDAEGLREQMRRYFLAWGICHTDDADFLYKGYDGDEHAPECVRVNAPTSMLDEWYDIFNAKWGDQNYLEPSQRVHLW